MDWPAWPCTRQRLRGGLHGPLVRTHACHCKRALYPMQTGWTAVDQAQGPEDKRRASAAAGFSQGMRRGCGAPRPAAPPDLKGNAPGLGTREQCGRLTCSLMWMVPSGRPAWPKRLVTSWLSVVPTALRTRGKSGGQGQHGVCATGGLGRTRRREMALDSRRSATVLTHSRHPNLCTIS